jgi:predicted kinase
LCGMSEHVEETIVDNEVYDLIKATASKLEGLAAYNKYEQNGQANAQVWRELRQQDEQAVRRLLQQIQQFARDGRLTAR